MQIPVTYLDSVVTEIVAECDHISPPLSADEIARHVLDAITDSLNPAVYAALERLAVRGVLHRDRTEGDTLRYRCATSADRRNVKFSAPIAAAF